ncbi:MAG: hypothetical protein KC766_13660 [Myxococcales bacterium]|nr:hypothetical protein [Myxococcales bacterium]
MNELPAANARVRMKVDGGGALWARFLYVAPPLGDVVLEFDLPGMNTQHVAVKELGGTETKLMRVRILTRMAFEAALVR